MPKPTPEQRLAVSRYVMDRLSELGKSTDWLVFITKLDRKTVQDFLSGERWPNPRSRQRIEEKLHLEINTLERIAWGDESVMQDRDPVEAAIDRSALSERNKLSLRRTYIDMLDDQERGAS